MKTETRVDMKDRQQIRIW